jgi:hypothetical protein
MSKAAPLDNLAPLAKAGVPIMLVCGGLDPCVGESRAAEERYKQVGGKINVVIREGEGHVLAGARDTTAVVEFITRRGPTGGHD